MKNTLKPLGLVACLSISPMMGFANILAAWDVDGVDVAEGTGVDTPSFPYTRNAATLGVNISEGRLSLGTNLPSTSTGMYGFRFSAATHQSSLLGAIEKNHCIQFTMTAKAGYRFDLSSIAMNGQSGTSGPDDIALMSSIDGFTAGDEMRWLTGRQGVTGGWDTDASGWGDIIDVSDLKYQDLTAVTFRIYGWNSSGTASAGIRNLSGNDLIINGTIEAIPEPAVAGLIGLTGLSLLVARRFIGEPGKPDEEGS